MNNLRKLYPIAFLWFASFSNCLDGRSLFLGEIFQLWHNIRPDPQIGLKSSSDSEILKAISESVQENYDGRLSFKFRDPNFWVLEHLLRNDKVKDDPIAFEAASRAFCAAATLVSAAMTKGGDIRLDVVDFSVPWQTYNFLGDIADQRPKDGDPIWVNPVFRKLVDYVFFRLFRSSFKPNDSYFNEKTKCIPVPPVSGRSSDDGMGGGSSDSDRDTFGPNSNPPSRTRSPQTPYSVAGTPPTSFNLGRAVSLTPEKQQKSSQ